MQSMKISENNKRHLSEGDDFGTENFSDANSYNKAVLFVVAFSF